MPYFTTISAINTTVREERTIKEEWTFYTNPPRTFSRNITTRKIEYVGIAASAQAALCAALRANDTNPPAIVDLYFVKGPANGGTIFCETLTGTAWVAT